jgi:hypothetical protein
MSRLVEAVALSRRPRTVCAVDSIHGDGHKGPLLTIRPDGLVNVAPLFAIGNLP